MKKTLRIFAAVGALLCTLQSCNAQKTVVNREVETSAGNKMLLGYQTRDQLSKLPYSEWYTPEYDSYTVDKKAVEELRKQKLSSYNLLVVLGIWCSDSHREVPRLMKILDAINFPENKLTLLTVNQKKEAPGGEEGLYNIKLVPTIIVQKYGKEIGRIVEYPTTGYLERDLLEILKKDDTNLKELFK
ncbi:thioredoxin [Chryseobacterium sp. 6424]|uniref:TlpA family protein disulfide reductase n=1 Tax=Chryseobacterium sp. 6424 TaxID=2039166 RepID=UPI000EFD29AE|nr:thioredoxin family protein [Chryseobacterium sp. 6424]AYO57657.1 thioredoxin [Chryseobacterium sp. 6424]